MYGQQMLVHRLREQKELFGDGVLQQTISVTLLHGTLDSVHSQLHQQQDIHQPK